MQEVPLGAGQFWPIYAACERHGPAARHPRGLKLPQSGHVAGWPTWYIEDYAAQSQGFQSRSAS